MLVIPGIVLVNHTKVCNSNEISKLCAFNLRNDEGKKIKGFLYSKYENAMIKKIINFFLNISHCRTNKDKYLRNYVKK